MGTETREIRVFLQTFDRCSQFEAVTIEGDLELLEVRKVLDMTTKE
jgi:hypothetical protein